MNTREVVGAVTVIVFLALVTVAVVASDGDSGPTVPPGLAPPTMLERGAPGGIRGLEPAPCPPVPPCFAEEAVDPHFVPVEPAVPPTSERRTAARRVENTDGAVSTSSVPVPADDPRPGVRSSDEHPGRGEPRGGTERTHPTRNQTRTATVQRS